MTIPFLDLAAASREVAADQSAAIERVLASGWYVLGPEVERFEREFAAHVGAAHCVGVANGLDALRLTLQALGIGPGDEVIVPSHTFIATWLAVSATGARPVPVEPGRLLRHRRRGRRGGDQRADRGDPSGPPLRSAGGHGPRSPASPRVTRWRWWRTPRRRTGHGSAGTRWARCGRRRVLVVLPGARISARSATAARSRPTTTRSQRGCGGSGTTARIASTSTSNRARTAASTNSRPRFSGCA